MAGVLHLLTYKITASESALTADHGQTRALLRRGERRASKHALHAVREHLAPESMQWEGGPCLLEVPHVLLWHRQCELLDSSGPVVLHPSKTIRLNPWARTGNNRLEWKSPEDKKRHQGS